MDFGTTHGTHKTFGALLTNMTDADEIAKHLDGTKVMERLLAPWADVKEFGANEYMANLAKSLGFDPSTFAGTSAPVATTTGSKADPKSKVKVQVSATATDANSTVALDAAVDALNALNNAQDAKNKAAGSDAQSVSSSKMGKWTLAQWVLAKKIHAEAVAALARLNASSDGGGPPPSAKPAASSAAPSTEVSVSVKTDDQTAAPMTVAVTASSVPSTDATGTTEKSGASGSSAQSGAAATDKTTEKRGRGRSRSKSGRSYRRSSTRGVRRN